MKKLLLSIIAILPSLLSAQSVGDAIANYRFDEASRMLQQEISMLQKKKQPTMQQEDMLRMVEKAKAKMAATERILFIDSIVVPKKDIYQHIPISSEGGKIRSFASQFQVEDSIGCSVYLNQFGNLMLLSQADENGNIHLYSRDKIGDEWTAPVELNGLSSNSSYAENYPFLLADGATLYYAAQDEDGLGGYDIYMTRYDADEHVFLAPENVGMPFNSPDNDYLMCIDEYYQLGWFVTDRNQIGDSVCIYTFVPNEVRRLYGNEDMEKLCSLARINAISDTWTSDEEVNAARQRLAEARINHGLSMEYDFTFILSDTRTCHFVGDFLNEKAREQVRYWRKNKRDLEQIESQLDALRLNYHFAEIEQRMQLASQIRILESQVESIKQMLPRQEKEIRWLELTN